MLPCTPAELRSRSYAGARHSPQTLPSARLTPLCCRCLCSEPTSLRPAVLVIHGGGWTGGDKADDREVNIASHLALHGFVALSANYRAQQQHPTPPSLSSRHRGCGSAGGAWRCNGATRPRADLAAELPRLPARDPVVHHLLHSPLPRPSPSVRSWPGRTQVAGARWRVAHRPRPHRRHRWLGRRALHTISLPQALSSDRTAGRGTWPICWLSRQPSWSRQTRLLLASTHRALRRGCAAL